MVTYTAIVHDQEELNSLIAAKSAMETLAYFLDSSESAFLDIRESIPEDTYSWKKIDVIIGKICECRDLTEETIRRLKESIENFWDE